MTQRRHRLHATALAALLITACAHKAHAVDGYNHSGEQQIGKTITTDTLTSIRNATDTINRSANWNNSSENDNNSSAKGIADRSIDEVTVLGSRTAEAVTAVRPLQELSRERLDLLGITSLADAVKQFAGANVKDYGGIGGMKTVSIRNMGAHHTAVSYDGVTISNTQAGQIDLGRYSLDNVQSLSLAVGDNADPLQSARHLASGGVLLINTERPSLTNQRPYSLRTSVKGGSFGYVNPSLRWWQRLSNKTLISLNADFMRADGVYPFTLVNGKNTTRERRNNSDIYSWRGEANIYHAIKDGELTAKAYWFYSERGLPGSVVLYNNAAHERLWDEDVFAQTSYRRQLSPTWSIAASAKYAHTWNRYTDNNTKANYWLDYDINRQNEYYTTATIAYTPNTHLTLSLAEDLAYNDLHSTIDDGAQPQRYSSLTALTVRYILARLEVNASLVGTMINETVESGDTPDPRRHLSPTAAVAYRLLPSEALYARLMFKHTFRVPTFNDMYYDNFGTRNLTNERANEYNLGLTWQSRPFALLRHLSLTADGYYNTIKDKLVAMPRLYVWKMTNYGKVNMYGVNLTAAAQLAVTRRIDLTLNAAYSLQRCLDVTAAGKSYYKHLLPYTPEQTGSGGAVLATPWGSVGYNFTACGERYVMIQNTAEYLINPYWEHNISLSKEFIFYGHRLNVSATIKNLFNEQYEIVRYYPMPGRSWTISATLTI